MLLTSSVSEPEGPVALPDGTWLVVEMSPDTGRVSHLEADGTLRRVVARTRRPNGLAVDGRGDMTGAVYRYRLSRGLTHRENFGNVLDPAMTPRHRGPDGMAFDTDGRLYCAVFGAGHAPSGGRPVSGQGGGDDGRDLPGQHRRPQ